MTDEEVLQLYYLELEYAIDLKVTGFTSVDADWVPAEIAAGRETVPIDEYMAMWDDGITAMEAGADTSQYRAFLK